MNVVKLSDPELIAIEEWCFNNITEYEKVPWRVPFQGDAFRIALSYPGSPFIVEYDYRKTGDNTHTASMIWDGNFVYKITIEILNIRQYNITNVDRVEKHYLDALGMMAAEIGSNVTSEMADVFKECVAAILAIATYVIFREKDFKVVQTKEVKTIKKGGVIQKAKGKNRFVKINTYELIGEVSTKSEKTRIKKMITCEAWGVRGHYRRYKNGKVVYIKPYVKGKKRNEVEPKDTIYKL